MEKKCTGAELLAGEFSSFPKTNTLLLQIKETQCDNKKFQNHFGGYLEKLTEI